MQHGIIDSVDILSVLIELISFCLGRRDSFSAQQSGDFCCGAAWMLTF